jgi:hypothetical protein
MIEGGKSIGPVGGEAVTGEIVAAVDHEGIPGALAAIEGRSAPNLRGCVEYIAGLYQTPFAPNESRWLQRSASTRMH